MVCTRTETFGLRRFLIHRTLAIKHTGLAHVIYAVTSVRIWRSEWYFRSKKIIEIKPIKIEIPGMHNTFTRH